MLFNKGKYVVGKLPSIGGQVMEAVAFSELVGHDTVGRRLFIEGSISSGGFFWLNGDEVVVGGKSDSLGVACNPEQDIPLLRRSLGLMGD